MKLSTLISGVAVGAVALLSQPVSAQVPVMDTTPGIVMAGSYDASKLPADAHKFLTRHFGAAKIVKCEQFYAKGKIEVELNTGVDVEFDMKGNVMEVDAPDGTYLSESLLRELLHKSAFERLEREGYASRVESVEFKKGKAVEVSVDRPDPDTYIFDLNGVLLMMQD